LEILVTMSVAERLGLLPRLPEGTIIETYKTASGSMRVYKIGGAYVNLLIGDADNLLAKGDHIQACENYGVQRH